METSNNNAKGSRRGRPLYTNYCGLDASRSGVAGSDSEDGAGVGFMRGPGSAPCETGLWEVELTGAAACEMLGAVVIALSGFSR